MRKSIALSAASIGILVACGPVSVDLGGGSGGDGTGGTGHAVGGSGGTGWAGAGAVGGSGDYGYCGDGIVQYPELCDDGGDAGMCPSDCGLVGGTGGTGVAGAGAYGGSGGSPDQYCGDGVVQYPEACDDPSGVECPFDCGIDSGFAGMYATGGAGGSYGGSGGYATGGVGGSGVAGSPGGGVCGDLVLDNGEWCDDGNTEDGDGCSADCRVEVGGAGGSFSTGGGPATGGVGGAYASGGMPSNAGAGGSGSNGCVTLGVDGGGECVDNDVLLGKAYERCTQVDRALTGVRFYSPCGDYGSYSIEIDCCLRSEVGGGAAGSGIGGSG